MKTWRRAPALTICGGPCRVMIRKGEPVLEIRIDGVDKRFLRCPQCAGEPVPADLPPLSEQVPIAPSHKSRTAPLFASAGSLAKDWKQSQAGREPGEDD